VDLVDDDAGESFHPLGSRSDRGVDLLAGGHHDVLVHEVGLGRVQIARRQADAHPRQLAERLVLLGRKRPQRRDVKRRAVGRQDCQLRDQRLAGRGRHRRDEPFALRHPGLDGGGLRRVQLLDPLLPEVVEQLIR
jgi:hypothetical protein